MLMAWCTVSRLTAQMYVHHLDLTEHKEERSHFNCINAYVPADNMLSNTNWWTE